MPEFIKPLPFQEARDKLSDRSPVASALKSADWQRVPIALRERAFFSATVENVRFLQRAKEELQDFATGARGINERGQSFLKTSRAEFVERLQKLAITEGIPISGPTPLQNPRSEARLQLIFDTNLKSAQDYGAWKQGMDPDVLDAFPAQRLIRVVDVRVPRRYHQENLGEVRLKSDIDFWLSMNPDFGVPWGPWGYNSGVDVEDVSREEAEALGLLAPGQRVQPMEKEFNERLQASVRNLDSQSLGFLELAFGDQVDVSSELVRWKNQARATTNPKPRIVVPSPTPTPKPVTNVLNPETIADELQSSHLQSLSLLEQLQKTVRTAPVSQLDTLARQIEQIESRARSLVEIPESKRAALKVKAKPSVKVFTPAGSHIVSLYMSPSILPSGETRVVSTRSRRPFYDPAKNEIAMSSAGSASVWAHEFMHWLEANNPQILKKSVEFLKSRTNGNSEERLQKLSPGSGYNRSEIVWKDEWEAKGGKHYVGKIYRGGAGELYATEILSMGIERLHANPALFAYQDREYFLCVLKTLRDL